MDTSKEYIQMCQEATQLQTLRIPIWGYCNFQMGDVFWKGGVFNKVALFVKLREEQDQPKTDETVWLPRQDQLQELILNSDGFKRYSPNERLAELFDHFAVWCRKTVNKETYLSTHYQETKSFEQLWLKYYMYCVHNKAWDGTNWK